MQEGKKTLADFFDVPKNIYPVGRLDYDSEGLLILTNDTFLNQELLHPSHNHKKEYWVQVEGICNNHHIHQLEKGVSISVDGKPYITKPCKAFVIEEEPKLYPRNPPIRERKNIPTNWLSLTITEGKNRQVRKMTAAVGLPTLRLVRAAIENITLQQMAPGHMLELSKASIYKKLQLHK